MAPRASARSRSAPWRRRSPTRSPRRRDAGCGGCRSSRRTGPARWWRKMMRPEAYPPQEPMSAIAKSYHDEVMRRGAGVTGEEIAYGADPYQSILIWRAPKPDGNLLAVLHGGGWTNGYKEWLAFMAPALTRAGITFASIGYRLAPPAGFSTGLAHGRA